MTSKESKMQTWAAERIIDDMIKEGLSCKTESVYYQPYREFFQEWHIRFNVEAWDKYIDQKVEELV